MDTTDQCQCDKIHSHIYQGSLSKHYNLVTPGVLLGTYTVVLCPKWWQIYVFVTQLSTIYVSLGAFRATMSCAYGPVVKECFVHVQYVFTPPLISFDGFFCKSLMIACWMLKSNSESVRPCKLNFTILVHVAVAVVSDKPYVYGIPNKSVVWCLVQRQNSYKWSVDWFTAAEELSRNLLAVDLWLMGLSNGGCRCLVVWRKEYSLHSHE